MEALKVNLKGTVDNEYLPKVGELFFKTKITNSPTRQYFSNSKAGTMRIVGDGNFLTSQGAVIGKTLAYGQPVYLSAGEYYLGLPEKYTLLSAQIVQNVDTSELRYTTGIPNTINFGNGCTGKVKDLYNIISVQLDSGSTITGTESDLNLSTLRKAFFYNGYATINIDNLSNSLGLMAIGVASDSQISGNLESLVKCTKLEQIYQHQSSGGTITGVVETFVEGHVENGRTSGTLQVVGIKSLTFHNATPPGYAIHFTFSASNVVVRQNNASGAIKGTYDIANDSWTY